MKKRTLKKGLLNWPILTLACTAALGGTVQAQTTGTVYHSNTNATGGAGTTTQLRKVDMASGVSTDIGGIVNVGYNGIGYYNGNLYGITSGGSVIRISPTTGVVTNIGVSLPAGNNYASGDIANGILYTTNMNGGASNHNLYKINITTLSYSVLNLPTQFADLVYYNGFLYGLANTGQVYRIDPNTAAITAVGTTNLGSASQAAWTDGSGIIYFAGRGTYNVATNQSSVGGAMPVGGAGGDNDATWGPASAPATTTLSGKLFSDPAGNHSGTTGTNGGGLYASLVNGSGTVVATVPLNADGTYSFSNVAAGTYSVALTTSASGSATPSLNPGWVITGEGYQVWDPVMDGKINNITVGTSPVTAVNFMVDRLPTAGSSTVNTTNPGGTGTINLTSNFTGTDPDGTVSQIHFISFPNNTTSITIGNTTYTASNWPATGVTVPVNTTVLLDPVDGTVTSVVPYKVIDNAGKESLNTGNVTINLTAPATYTVSGNVYDDANGGTIDGTGTNAGGTLYVVLTNASGTIIGSSPVAANGTYSVPSVPAGTYTATLTTSPTSTTATLPTGWVNTNEGLTTAGDGTVNGKIPSINVTGNVAAANFGLDQLPTAGSSTVNTTNPGGTGTINLTSNFTSTAGTDPDGTVSQIHFTTFPNNTTSITIGNTTYTSSNWPATGVTVPVNTTVLIDPVDGTVTPVVPYKVIDNAGKESLNTGNVTVNLTAPATYTVSGNVYDDANGGTIDGTGTNAGGTLYVVLTNASGTIIGSSPVAANGTYSVSVPAGTYTATLTTSPTSTTATLPTGWVNTNEGLTTTGDGTVNGKIPSINVAGNVAAANFGLDQLPTAGSSTVNTTNPGGTGTINLTSNFTSTAGTDPDGTVSQIHFIGFPNNTTSITIGNNTYTASNWPATGVTVPVNTTVLLDPVDGTVTPVVPYKVIDNAGKESLNTGNVTVTITASGGTPDLTPTLVIDNLSFPVADVTRDFIVNVFEINGAATTAGSTIKVRLAKLSGFTITYPTESGMSDVDGGIANENSNWTFTETSSFIFATAKPGVTIGASDVARLGFKISRKAGIINGTTQNLTTTIIAPSGGETNTVNNVAITSFTASSN